MYGYRKERHRNTIQEGREHTEIDRQTERQANGETEKKRETINQYQSNTRGGRENIETDKQRDRQTINQFVFYIIYIYFTVDLTH